MGGRPLHRGRASALVKRNEQLPPDSEVARKLGNRVLSALTASPRFISAAIPLQDLSAAVQPLCRVRTGTISASTSTTR